MCLESKFGADQARISPNMAVPRADPFDRLHDFVLLQIFNRVGDIKALGRCSVVSKRFHSMVFLVENVTVKVDCVISGEDNALNVKGRGVFGHLVRLFVGSIVKPFQVLQQVLGLKKVMLAEVSHHSPGEVLKNFKAIQSLKIELPGGELGIEDGVLLKWRAEFGSTLDSCVILGASELVKSDKGKKRDRFESVKPWFLQGRSEERAPVVAESAASAAQDDGGSLPESFYTNGGLKLRVVWTISSLIAASARHFLLQQIIAEHPTLASLVLTDADGQGTLCMCKNQLHEFKNKPPATSASSNRTQVPALNMKLWYSPYLDLPGGMGLKGATLVSIRPSDKPICKDVDGSVYAAFEEPFKTAANLLVKRRTYLLEMNSF